MKKKHPEVAGSESTTQFGHCDEVWAEKIANPEIRKVATCRWWLVLGQNFVRAIFFSEQWRHRREWMDFVRWGDADRGGQICSTQWGWPKRRFLDVGCERDVCCRHNNKRRRDNESQHNNCCDETTATEDFKVLTIKYYKMILYAIRWILDLSTTEIVLLSHWIWLVRTCLFRTPAVQVLPAR